MQTLRKQITVILATIFLLGFHFHADASVILAQIIDENPPIRGVTYVNGVLFQNIVLADETFSDRFTGFLVIDGSSRPLDYFNVTFNIYAPDHEELVATLGMSGGPEWPLIHTMYYSAYPGAELTPWDSPTGNLTADGNFHTVLEFAADNGDQYMFQYKNIMAEVPEPTSTLLLAAGLFVLLIARRRC
jgi:hypothetical protein